MSDAPEQTCPPCATYDTMLLPDKHYLNASDAVTDGDVTKKARVNYEQIIRQVARSVGHDSDDKGDRGKNDRRGTDTDFRGAQ